MTRPIFHRFNFDMASIDIGLSEFKRRTIWISLNCGKTCWQTGNYNVDYVFYKFKKAQVLGYATGGTDNAMGSVTGDKNES